MIHQYCLSKKKKEISNPNQSSDSVPAMVGGFGIDMSVEERDRVEKEEFARMLQGSIVQALAGMQTRINQLVMQFEHQRLGHHQNQPEDELDSSHSNQANQGENF